MQTGIEIKYKSWDCEIEISEYMNGQTCIELVDIDSGEIIVTATTNAPSIGFNAVIIDASTGIMEIMENMGLIQRTGDYHDENLSIPSAP